MQIFIYVLQERADWEWTVLWVCAVSVSDAVNQNYYQTDIQTTGQETKQSSILPGASLTHTIFGTVRSSLLP